MPVLLLPGRRCGLLLGGRHRRLLDGGVYGRPLRLVLRYRAGLRGGGLLLLRHRLGGGLLGCFFALLVPTLRRGLVLLILRCLLHLWGGLLFLLLHICRLLLHVCRLLLNVGRDALGLSARRAAEDLG